MSNGERSTSAGTVIGFGFIILGILNLFASRLYHRTSISTTNRVPGFLFIAIGITILIIKAIKKTRE
jgi:hypothetical protein